MRLLLYNGEQLQDPRGAWRVGSLREIARGGLRLARCRAWPEVKGDRCRFPATPATGSMRALTAVPPAGSSSIYSPAVRSRLRNLPVLLLLCSIVFIGNVRAQSVGNYAVTRATGITYTSISSTGSSLSSWRNGTDDDDNRSAATSIGFDFWYNGTRYTTFSVSTNGYVDFSSSSANGGGTSAYGYQNTQFSAVGGTLLSLAPIYDDLDSRGTGQTGLDNAVKYQLSGTAPNRVLTIEWVDMIVYNNTSPSLNFQVKVYESTGVIEFIYGSMTAGTASYTYTCGINAATMSSTPTAAELLTQQTANTATFSNTPQNGLSTIPASNTRLRFTPPTPANPSGTLTFTNVSSNSMRLNWTDWASNEVGYVIYRSTDGVDYTFVSQTAANATFSDQSGLLPSTTYYWRVYAVTEGRLSSALSGSQATAAVGSMSFKSSSSGAAPSGTVNLTINKPVGTASGDVMLAAISVRPNTATITPPSGWTLIRRTDQASGTANSQATYWKAAGGSEPSSYTWSFSTSTGSAGGILTFSGIDNFVPVHVENGQATANGLTHTAPSVTTTIDSTIVVTSHSFSSSATWTPPSGMTEAVDTASLSVPNAAGIAIEVNYALQASAGATGTKSATASGDSDVGVAQIVALRPVVTVSFTSSSQSASEDVGTMSIMAQLSAPHQVDVTVPFTVSGTATNPDDYTITASPLVIPAGSMTGTITITVVDDAAVESDETVIITMGTPTNATQGAIAVHTATIQDNDGIRFDAASSAQSGSAGTTLSWSHTIGGGSNRILVVGIQVEDASAAEAAVQGVTYNGVALTRIDAALAGTTFFMNVELWYLLNASLPAAGTYTITVTTAGTTDNRIGGAVSLYNVAQQGAEATNKQISNSGLTSLSTSVTTLTAGAWLVDAIGSGNASTGFSPTASGQTERYDLSASSSQGAGSTRAVGAPGSYDMSWSISGSNRLAHVVAAFAPPTASAKTWDGGAGTNNWGDAANWNPDGVPTSSTDVNLSGANTININVAASAKSLTLDNSGLTLTILSGNSLTLSGSLIINGGTLATQASFPSVSGTVSISGGTVNFSGTGLQTIPAYNYFNLTSSSTGSRTLAGSGTIGIAGTFAPGSNSYTITGSTIDYNGTGAQTVAAFNYNNLTISGTRTTNNVTWSSTGTIGIAGAFTLSATFTSGGYVVTGSTVNYNGSGNQTIASTTYHNLSVTSTGGTVTLLTTTVNNNFSVVSGTVAIGDDNTPRSVSVSGDLTVAAGSTLQVSAASDATHTLTVTGNVSNEGTLNFRPDGNSFCNTTFNKNGNQTVSGSGAITSFNAITLNMGTSNANVLEVAASNFSAPNGFLTLTNGTFKLSSASTVTPFTADITTSPYLIPSTAGLWVNGGTVSTTK